MNRNGNVKVFLSALLLTFVLLSCAEENTDKPLTGNETAEQKTANADSVTGKRNKIDSVRAIKERKYLKKLEETKPVKPSPEKNLTKEQLMKFIPETPEGFRQVPGNAGVFHEASGSITTYIKWQFKDKGNKTVIFDIFDYGLGNEVNKKGIYEMPPTDLDAPVARYKSDLAKGFFYWLKDKAYGHIEVMADNRFVIVVRLSGFAKEDKLLENYLNKINIKALIDAGKKSNQ